MYQSNPGQAGQMFFSNPTYGWERPGTTAVDSEGVQLGRMQQQNLSKQLDFQGGQAGLDRLFQGGQADAGRLFQGQQSQLGRDFEGQQNAANRDLSLQLGMAPLNFKKDVFGQVMPLIQGLMGSGAGGSTPGALGAFGAVPQVSTGGVFSDKDISGQVNNQQAKNANAQVSQGRQAAAQTAGQGFGTRSPLLAALQQGFAMNRQSQDATASREIPLQYRQANNDAMQKGQMANQGAALQGQANQVAAANSQRNYTTSLLGALAGLV